MIEAKLVLGLFEGLHYDGADTPGQHLSGPLDRQSVHLHTYDRTLPCTEHWHCDVRSDERAEVVT